MVECSDSLIGVVVDMCAAVGMAAAVAAAADMVAAVGMAVVAGVVADTGPALARSWIPASAVSAEVENRSVVELKPLVPVEVPNMKGVLIAEARAYRTVCLAAVVVAMVETHFLRSHRQAVHSSVNAHGMNC